MPWRPDQALATDRGIYVAVYDLAEATQLVIGALGAIELAAGRYLYVGSAQRHLLSRLRRHARREKSRRWHMDYLAAHGVMRGAWVLPGAPKHRECEVAATLSTSYVRPVSGFGSSDCQCESHLFWMPASES
ncbi:MAG: GIY-YIG nuclease family protein [bacterium]